MRGQLICEYIRYTIYSSLSCKFPRFARDVFQMKVTRTAFNSTSFVSSSAMLCSILYTYHSTLIMSHIHVTLIVRIPLCQKSVKAEKRRPTRIL